jgi:hypothetical protein
VPEDVLPDRIITAALPALRACVEAMEVGFARPRSSGAAAAE